MLILFFCRESAAFYESELNTAISIFIELAPRNKIEALLASLEKTTFTCLLEPVRLLREHLVRASETNSSSSIIDGKPPRIEELEVQLDSPSESLVFEIDSCELGQVQPL